MSFLIKHEKKINYVNSKKLFKSNFKKHLPDNFFFFKKSNIKNDKIDLDIIITSYNQLRTAKAVIENYSLYEKKLNLHFIVIDNSFNIFSYFFFSVKNVKITKIFLFPFSLKLKKLMPVNLKGSTSLAVSMQIGLKYSLGKYIFTSHSDMCTLKKNFFSLLKSIYIEKNIDFLSCTQRHILPFMCGGTFFRADLKNKYDWLPDYEAKHIDKIPSNFYKNSFENYKWLDVGEKFCFGNFKFGILESRGTKKSAYEHPLERYCLYEYILENHKIINFFYYLKSVSNTLSLEKHFEFSLFPMWRKTFYENEIIFLHAGRGSRKFLLSRGDFYKFLKKINNEKK